MADKWSINVIPMRQKLQEVRLTCQTNIDRNKAD